MSEAQFTLPRGMKDIDPEEMSRRIWLTDKIRQVLWNYGFQMLEPSPVENLETLEAKSGPAVRDEIYWFKDKAERNLGLRFDLTVGMTRMVANRFDLPEPIKISCIGGVWRYDEPQFARYRYHTQWDAEIYGVADPSADAEIIALGSDILDSVGLKDHLVKLSNRKLVEGFLRGLGIQSQNDLDQLIRIVDKMGKIGSEQAEREFTRAGLTQDKVKRILGFADINGDPDKVLGELENKLPKGEMIHQGFNELSGTVDRVESLGKKQKIKIDLGIVRGISYYDGTVFEAYDRDGEDVGAIFGGGRFDKLCRIYGKRDMPATGVAGGFERLMLSLERKDLFPNIREHPQVFVVTVNETVWNEAVKIVQQLRSQGTRTDYDLKQRPLSKQLEYADSLKARVSLVLGPREIKEGSVRLKDMKTGEEKIIKLASVADEVRKTLA
ncbi:MAG TPA: histidine--tRNA ligase [Candidatus Sulfotelmatobacter sp.]|nr:histidine--tRNA ligase [Candidatus Sulfotelmatobacter sp.]